MDQLIGKWRMNHDLTENWDAYCAAMDIPQAVKDAMKTSTIEAEMTKDGDKYNLVTRYGDHSDTLTFKMGEKFNSKVMGTMDTENIFKEEGGKVVGDHKIGSKECTTTRYIQDGKLVVETTGYGVTLKNVMEKC